MGKQADHLNAKFGALKVAAIGAFSVMGGAAIVGGIVKLTEFGDKLVEVQSRLAQLGVSQAGINQLSNAAFASSMKYPVVTYDKSLETGIYGRETLGTTNRSARALPTMTRILADLENMPTLKGDGMHAFHQMLKSIDIFGLDTNAKGKLSVGGLNSGLREMLSAVQQSQGLVTPSMLYRGIKQIGSQGRMFDFHTFLPVIAEATAQMGTRAGRGIANVVKQFTGGTFAKNYGMAMARFGLLKHGMDSIRMTKNGSYEALKNSGELVDSKLFFANEPLWIKQVLIPALVKQGYKSIPSQLGALNQIFNTKPSTAFIGSQISNPESYDRAQNQIDKQLGVKNYAVAMATNLPANVRAFKSAFTSLLEVLGTSLVPKAIIILQDMTSAIVGVTKWAKIHPAAISAIVDGLGVLGVALVGFGTTAVVGALVALGGVPALIGGTVAAIIAAAGVVALNFSHIEGWLSQLVPSLQGFNTWLGAIEKNINHFLEHPFAVIGSGLKDAANGFVRDVTGSKSGVAPWAGRSAAVPSHFDSPGNPLAPQAVHIANTGDVAKAIKHGLAASLSQNQGSTTGFNGRSSAFGTPAFTGP